MAYDMRISDWSSDVCSSDLIERLRVSRKAVYTFHSRLARRLQKGRVFLVGDAAHIMPIFGSQGMNSGARDVKNLAWKLAAVLNGKATGPILDARTSVG